MLIIIFESTNKLPVMYSAICIPFIYLNVDRGSILVSQNYYSTN